MIDLFKNDAFSVVSMTEAINKLPFVPSRLGAMGLFPEKGITTKTAVVEEKHGRLSLIPTAARGSMPTVESGPRRNARSFLVPHLPVNDAALADDVQDVRAFGSESELATLSELVNDKLAAMKQDLEVTKEYHRIGAVQGNILDADGVSVIYNLFDEFGLTEQEVEFTFGSDEELKTKCTEVIRLIEDALGAGTYSGIQALCGDDFFDNLCVSPAVKDAFNRWQDGQFLRDLQTTAQGATDGFLFGGINWLNYRGSVGAVDFIPTETARFFPVGVPQLFGCSNAPAPFTETVNTLGKSMYAKQERMKWDIGVELHAQANPLMMCTRPGVLIKGVYTGAGSSSS